MSKQKLLQFVLTKNSRSIGWQQKRRNIVTSPLSSILYLAYKNNNYQFSSINNNNKSQPKHNSQQQQQVQLQQKTTKNSSSFLGNGKVDQLTSQTLSQYQTKLKQIRHHHNSIQQQIKDKYNPIINQLQSKLSSLSNITNTSQLNNKQTNTQYQQQQQLLQQQLQAIRLQRMNELLNNQSKLKSKIQLLTSQYTKQISLSRKQYQLQYIKNYMLQNLHQFKSSQNLQKNQNHTKPILLQELIASTSKSKNQSSYIPNNLVLKKLYFTHDNNKQSAVLLAGIEQNNQDHCAYLKTLIQKLKIKHVLSMISPDMPYFIKTQTSFLSQWRQFLKIPSPTVKFYLNPNPKTLNDITLASTHIPLVLHGMTKSKTFYQTTFSLMQMNEATFKYQHQPLFSGLIAGMVENVYFCDYPFLKQREMIAMNVNLEDLRQLMKRYAYYKKHQREHFSAQLLLPKTVVEKKYRHIIKLAKTIALTKQSTPILICPASIAQVLAQEWQKSAPQYLQFDYTQNSYLLDMELNKQGQKQTLFIQFIEKLVILDIILQPLIQKYFVKYGSFPYSCRNTVGGKENLTKVFLLWRHYYSLYSNAVDGKFTTEKDKWQVPL